MRVANEEDEEGLLRALTNGNARPRFIPVLFSVSRVNEITLFIVVKYTEKQQHRCLPTTDEVEIG